MKERILEHLLQHRSITTLEAVERWGCLMLPHYIWQLRNLDNIDIQDEWILTKNRYGEKVKFKRYWIGGAE